MEDTQEKCRKYASVVNEVLIAKEDEKLHRVGANDPEGCAMAE
ncbi:hypothetical protein [Dickeya dianthicola]